MNEWINKRNRKITQVEKYLRPNMNNTNFHLACEASHGGFFVFLLFTIVFCVCALLFCFILFDRLKLNGIGSNRIESITEAICELKTHRTHAMEMMGRWTKRECSQTIKFHSILWWWWLCAFATRISIWNVCLCLCTVCAHVLFKWMKTVNDANGEKREINQPKSTCIN